MEPQEIIKGETKTEIQINKLEEKKLSFARKYRPQTFAELIGQEITSETLKKSIKNNQTAQAFLFCGSRGTGKTSCARIFAKALNCTNTQSIEPCNNCTNCIEVNKDCAIDTIEIDAASNRGIDNIRKVRDNLSYLPIQGKYKVYIIDEVHMLTMESFNALLKSIEEPPAYLKFILATTHPHKIPDTVISRCQRYNFQNISSFKMKTHLQKIAQLEGIIINDIALEKIVQISDGALRDALTNLEMVYSFCGKNITEQAISQILVTTSQDVLSELFLAIVDKDPSKSIKVLHSIFDQGIAVSVFLVDFLFFIHRLSLQKITADVSKTLQKLQGVLQKISFSKLQQYFQVLLEIQENVKMSKVANLCVEMGMLKLCSINDFANLQDILMQIEKQKENEQSRKYSTTPTPVKISVPVSMKPNINSDFKKENEQSRKYSTTPTNSSESTTSNAGILQSNKISTISFPQKKAQNSQIAFTTSLQNSQQQEQNIDERVKIAQDIFKDSKLIQ